jgi:hypothetical protein
MPDKNSHPISPLRRRDWIVLTAFIVAVAAGFGVYSEWIGPEVGLRRIEGNTKSNLPLRIDPNKTLVDVKYERNHSSYWYVVNNADQFDPQETARQVQDGLCSDAENLRAIKEGGFSYEYHYKTKEGRALADFKVSTCPED